MTRAVEGYSVYLETGRKRTFAASLDWPGWARSGRDEQSALQALLDYAARYERVLAGTGLKFKSPQNLAAFKVIERLEGNATTDFGAPGVVASSDHEAPDVAELERYGIILRACWEAFDAAVTAARGKELAKGPRGGGRELDKIVDHVQDAEVGYTGTIGHPRKKSKSGDPAEETQRRRQEILKVVATAQGAVPPSGPRGGKRWPWRYFVRRMTWHVLDHAWEIEDRAT